MRSALLVTAIIACACAHAMPLGLRTAMWGVARAGGAAADAEDDPIPELPPSASSSEVADALSGSVDAGLVANIVSGEVYVAYHGWVQDVTNATAASAVAIKGSPHAWLSFALGADALIEGELTSDDVKIESFTPSAVDGAFEFVVSVKDVNIGGGSVAEAILKENLKKVFGLEGAATLDLGAFSSDKIDISFEATVDGKARFTAKPPAGVGNSFFMRVKVKK